MNCNQVKELLSSYIDGEIDGSDSRLIKQHLKECDLCRSEHARLRAVSFAVRGLPEMQAPPNFMASLQEKLQERKIPWYRKAISAIDQALAAVPLKTMTAAAAVILAVTVVIVSQNPDGLGGSQLAQDDSGLLAPETAEPVEAAPVGTGSQPLPEQPEIFATPRDLLTAIAKRDPAFRKYRPLSHPQGMGIIIKTDEYVIEALIDPASFESIRNDIEKRPGRMPNSLREAAARYPIKIRLLPSPTRAMGAEGNK